MANPMYSEHLDYAPTFRWGGREWGEGAGSLDAFMKKIGGPKKYSKWARKHRVAAKSFDPIEGQIYSQYQPVFTGIDAERKKKADYYQRLMKNLGGFASALGPMLSGVDSAIGGAYGEAAETMGAVGSGFGVNLNNASAAAASGANQVLGAIGAPQGQMLQGGDAGGVLAGLAGWIPQSMMNTQGGAYAAAASQLPKSAGLEAQYMMKDILDKAVEEEGDFSTEIMKLLQGLPGARAELKTASQKSALLKQDFKLKQLEANRDWYLDQAKLAFLSKDQGRKDKMLELAEKENQQAIWESQGRDFEGNVAPDYHVDPATGRVIPNDWRYNPKTGGYVKIGVAGSSGSGGKDTPAKNAIKKIDEAGDNIQSDIADIVTPPGGGEFDPDAPVGGSAAKVKYGPTFQKLLGSYRHLAKNNPRALAYLKQLIRAKLIAAGVKPPAGGGNRGGNGGGAAGSPR